MTYTPLTADELVMIESYFKKDSPVSEVACTLKRLRETIYSVYRFLKQGYTAFDHYQTYKENKACCGRRPILLSKEQTNYVQKKVAQGWTPDVIVGRAEFPIDCSSHTLYRMFQKRVFNTKHLPMQGKRKPNGHQEKRGKQAFRRSIHERHLDYQVFVTEFGHLEGTQLLASNIKVP